MKCYIFCTWHQIRATLARDKSGNLDDMTAKILYLYMYLYLSGTPDDMTIQRGEGGNMIMKTSGMKQLKRLM